MGTANLATVFGPNILRGKESNAVGMIEGMQAANVIFDALITNYEVAFKGQGSEGIKTRATSDERPAPSSDISIGARTSVYAPKTPSKEETQVVPSASDTVVVVRKPVPQPKSAVAQTPPTLTHASSLKVLPPVPTASTKPKPALPAMQTVTVSEVPANPSITLRSSAPNTTSASSAPKPSTSATPPADRDKTASTSIVSPSATPSPSPSPSVTPESATTTIPSTLTPASNPVVTEPSSVITPASALPTLEPSEQPSVVTTVAATKVKEVPDINTRIQREGSGVLLRDVIRTLWGLASFAAQKSPAGAPLQHLNNLLKDLAQGLREVFPVIKLYVTHNPSTKTTVLDKSLVLQEKAKNLILAAKQVKSTGAGMDGIFDPVRELIECMYCMVDTCDKPTLDWVRGIGGLVQECAQHTTKILHIAFGAVDDSVSGHAKAALLSSEQLLHRAHIASVQMRSAEGKAVLQHASDVAQLVQQLGALAEKQHLDSSGRADIESEAHLRDVAKQLAGHFRTITMALGKDNETSTPSVSPADSQILEEACDLLNTMFLSFPDETSMMPHERDMIQRCRSILTLIQRLQPVSLSTATNEVYDILREISSEIWAMNELVEDAGKLCTDVGLTEQLFLYKRALCHFDHALLLSAAVNVLPAQASFVITTHPSWVGTSSAVGGVAGCMVPMLKLYFLACLLRDS
eukprot:TRINITY_DN836_c0_g1_i1.p1 TRINITY_DN836_c0_g1~~TRINITY_DN836_c0_g1_i1.p1  ORF type:complete len:692 (-),score=85.96 TRINITY_DN836_c0_g1_i1:88-2163(-)